jgi:hypothetical protein
MPFREPHSDLCADGGHTEAATRCERKETGAASAAALIGGRPPAVRHATVRYCGPIT